jgi:hypothetical protein
MRKILLLENLVWLRVLDEQLFIKACLYSGDSLQYVNIMLNISLDQDKYNVTN